MDGSSDQPKLEIKELPSRQSIRALSVAFSWIPHDSVMMMTTMRGRRMTCQLPPLPSIAATIARVAL